MAWGIGEGDAACSRLHFFSSGEVAYFRCDTSFRRCRRRYFQHGCRFARRRQLQVIVDGKLRPSVVVPVTYFGLPANSPEIRKVAEISTALRFLRTEHKGFGGEIT